MSEQLRFGYRGAPAADVAWGARLIVTQDGTTDFVYDRQDCIGPDDERKAFLDTFNERYPLSRLRGDVGALLATRRISTRESKEVVLYEDDDMGVVGNTNGSAGYFYVTAYKKGGE